MGMRRNALKASNLGIDLKYYAILAEDYFKPQPPVCAAVANADEKSKICRYILESLPDWFGNPSAIGDYCEYVRSEPMFAAYDIGKPIGFIAVKERNSHTAEIDAMGILPGYHRRGYGRALVTAAEQFSVAQRRSFLLVKTLDYSSEYEPYARTRKFYLEALHGQ